MFDFCYVANVLLLVHIWVFPHSAFLHKVRCCSAFGRSALLGVVNGSGNAYSYHPFL